MLTLLDYLGTFAFGLSGAIVAVERKMDIVGILILSTFTGIGGGILRDVVLGNTPPIAFLSHHYFIILIVSGFLVFFFYKKLKGFEPLIVILDALGLGVFTLIGIEKALLASHNLNQPLPLLSVILIGIMTATFGGLLRDVLANRVPFILKKEIYASACFLGGILFFLTKDILPKGGHYALVISFVTFVRLIAYFKKWNLPKAKL